MPQLILAALVASTALVAVPAALPTADAACLVYWCVSQENGCAPLIQGYGVNYCGGQGGVCAPSVYDQYALACAGTYYGCVPYFAIRGGIFAYCGTLA